MALSDRMQGLFHDLQTAAASLGWTVTLESGERSCIEQRRVSKNPCSHHLSGNAIDIGAAFRFDNPQGIDPALTPEAPVAAKNAVLRILGGIAKEKGFRWGGDFRTPDRNHFDDGLLVGAPICCSGSAGNVAVRPSSRGVETGESQPVRRTPKTFVCRFKRTPKRTSRLGRACQPMDEPVCCSCQTRARRRRTRDAANNTEYILPY